MKKSLKSILACLLALVLVVPALSGALAEDMVQVKGTLESKSTVRIDVSGIRNGRTLTAANTEAKDEIAPDTIVDIMVELDKAPTADVTTDIKGANSYREELKAAQKQMVNTINEKLGLEIVPTYNYTVLFNGFAFSGEYRLIEELNKIEGVKAFMGMEWESPKLFNTTNQVGATTAWDLGYSGEGACIAIIDTGCKVTHEAFSVQPENVKYTEDDIAMFIELGNLQGSNMNPTQVYYSAKIPFRWNYVQNNYNVNHVSSDHGTHVSGIAAGNGGEIQGVAKDAQLAIMQVFNPGGGAGWVAILAALEDCVVLGVDSANLSLGSPCGREDYWDNSYGDVFERVVNAGVSLAMAAGNDYNAAMCNAWSDTDVTTGSFVAGGYNLATNPDSGVVGSPSTWEHGMSVAAVQNSKAEGFYIAVDGCGYGYTENESNMAQLADTLGGQTLEFVMVPGYGEPSDYVGIDVQGKVAVVSRGSTSFVEKGYAAQDAGAAACIVYNNNWGEVLNMVPFGTLDGNNNLIHDGNEGQIPHIAITREVAQNFMDAEENLVYISAEYGIYDAAGGNMPSDFSSWGCTATLGMKPEITAPGGAIYSATDSAISGADYQAWDGTSMATPHIAGGMAIVTEYVAEMFPNLSAREQKVMVDTILMCTATPVFDSAGDYALVRDQGAGEMNLEKAVQTKAYITVEGCARPKLEIGDDPEKTGVYTLTFTVHNFGSEELKYTVRPSLLINDLALLGYMDEAGEYPVIVNTDKGYDLYKDGMATANMPNLVVVPAGGETEVTVTLSLTDEAKDYMDTYYTSGTNVEGFIELLPANGLLGDANGDGKVDIADATLVARAALGLVTLNANVDMNGDGNVNIQDATLVARVALGFGTRTVAEEGVSLTVPFLGFYGDWNYAETIDIGYYYEDIQMNSNNYPNTAGYKSGNVIQPLGFNPFIDTEDLSYYLADRNAISPNNDGTLDKFNLMYCGLLRNSDVSYLVLDTNGNQLGTIASLGVCTKGFFDTNLRDQLGVNYGQMPGNYNFQQYNRDDLIVRIQANLDNDGRRTENAFSPELSKNNVWDIPLHIDLTAPVVSNFSASGNTFSIDVTDEHYVAYVAVYTNNDGQLGNLVSETGVFETERGVTSHFNMSGSTNNFVLVGDYAGNVNVYLWNGTQLVLQQGVDPNPVPVGSYEDCCIFAYGMNLSTKQWTMFRSEDPTDLYNGEVEPFTTTGIAAAGYDRENGICYAVASGNTPTLYRYDMTDAGLANKTTIATLTNAYNEMAYDNANGILFGISGATELYMIDVTTGEETSVGSIGNGVMGMDFDENGILYYVDAYGVLCSCDIYGDGAINELAETGKAPVNLATGSFYSQSGCMIGHTFYWGSIEAASGAKDLIRFDVTTGAYESIGLILQNPGMQATGMFAVDMQINNYAPKALSSENGIVVD